MANNAILVGNSEYRKLLKLDCCRDDLAAIKQLLEATQKYAAITVIENAEADSLKDQLRQAVDEISAPSELFFYFTGHGYGHEGEFYHCATNFDIAIPNQTGLSTTELHAILRPANAALVVKVVDACNSGTRLIKSEESLFRLPKEGFQSIIQIASCLDSQNSLAGEPLSLFTEKFRDAVLRKSEGPVFYMDIVSALRDAFIGDDDQTPHFVAQLNGKEQFIDDATKLDVLRQTLQAARVASTPPTDAPTISQAPRSLLERLQAAEAKVVTPKLMSTFVGKLFDDLKEKITSDEFAEFFELERSEESHFNDAITEQFIIRVLTKETRADNFVTATYDRKARKPSRLYGAATGFDLFNPEPIYDEEWLLRLNVTMERAQLKIVFTPRFANLQRIKLVVTCAPSLDHCYIFEIATQHRLRDFTKYDSYGPEVSRRWWKCTWSEGTGGIVNQISEKIAEVVRQQLESAEKRLAGESKRSDG